MSVTAGLIHPAGTVKLGIEESRLRQRAGSQQVVVETAQQQGIVGVAGFVAAFQQRQAQLHA